MNSPHEIVEAPTTGAFEAERWFMWPNTIERSLQLQGADRGGVVWASLSGSVIAETPNKAGVSEPCVSEIHQASEPRGSNQDRRETQSHNVQQIGSLGDLAHDVTDVHKALIYQNSPHTN
jgi:hypothetical protein